MVGLVSIFGIFYCIFTYSYNILALSTKPSNKQNYQYESIDSSTFKTYEALWRNTHSSWTNIDDTNIACPELSTSMIFPVCQGGVVVDGQNPNERSEIQCSNVQCYTPQENDCLPTPSDTIDYLPILSTSSADDAIICAPEVHDSVVIEPYYGLFEGIPPQFTSIQAVMLRLSGNVRASFENKCETVRGASITAWQINPTMLNNYTSKSERLDSYTNETQIKHGSKTSGYSSQPYKQAPKASSTSKPPQSLRDISCSGQLHTGGDGRYYFTTTMPPAYGPPRHIAIMVSAPGFETLYTRVYFDQDGRLQQLTSPTIDAISETKIYGKTGIYHRNKNISGIILEGNDDGFQAEQNHVKFGFQGPITNDPRVAKLNFVGTPVAAGSAGLVVGHFEAEFNVVLKPLRPTETGSDSPMPPLDVTGLWSERDGGLINVESIGNVFIATEYPHQRTWGTVVGVLSGDFVRGVDFSHNLGMTTTAIAANIGINGVQRNPDGSIDITHSRPQNFTHLLSSKQITGKPTLPSQVFSSGFSSGVILPVDSFASMPITHSTSQEVSIRWGGGGYENIWSKMPPQKQGYRYFKLQITRETGGLMGGVMHINEIEFYAGVLARQIVPAPFMKMTTPRLPVPQMVTCSSYQDISTHCYRAFDGDSSSNSVWATQPVGSSSDKLSSPQWVLFDLGPNHFAQPTAMKIVCGAGVAEPQGCPKTFTLFGSYDNMLFDVIYTEDLYDYNNDYANGGKLFQFFWESPTGRPDGAVCGSCQSGPLFSCAIQSFDRTCSSLYCDVNGRCGEQPPCEAGQYLDTDFTSEGVPALQCRLCSPGRYGNSSGLTNSYCTDTCAPGYFCPAGSVSPLQQECGGVGLFCPEGSALPKAVAAGHYSVDSMGGTTGSINTRVTDAPCPAGHYCVGGVPVQCPVGRYGSVTGLQTMYCSGECLTGEYCPIGSIQPTICEKGYFCPDGRTHVICPAGTYGAILGLQDRRCSGLCKPGFYCPAGSTSSKAVICPAGRFGSVSGLQDSPCSGPCEAGYYCPEGSRNSTAAVCGSPAVFCPVGSPSPTTVVKGYYSTGGFESRRQSQAQCLRGFYCNEGVMLACPPGTYGSTTGLSYNNSFGPIVISFMCSGFCQPGYYCPSNSTSPTQAACPAGRYGATVGLTDSNCTAICPPGHFCPVASVGPTKCRAGIFGNQTGLTSSSCSGSCWEDGCDPALCQEGYYCPEASMVGTQVQCGGPDKYCPTGSALPTAVMEGYYTVGPFPMPNVFTRTDQRICEVGHYCTGGIKRQCPPGTYGSTLGLTTPACSGLCAAGYYCPIESFNATVLRCPAGRYGTTSGLFNSACSGVCSPGYYCPEASVSPTAFECATLRPSGIPGTAASGIPVANNSDWVQINQQTGDINVLQLSGSQGLVRSTGNASAYVFVIQNPNLVFCPEASSQPLSVLPGFYSFGSNKTTRSAQLPCLPGAYCSEGVMRDCPAGRYGRAEKLTSPACTGPCQKGHYCPAGSTSRTQYACPLGRYGAEEGLSTAACSGPCPHPLDCPAGSVRKVPLPTKQASDLW